MPTASTPWLPADLQAQQLQQAQKYKLQEALLGSMKAPEAQMVGGRYISPGIVGGMMPLLQALLGQKLESKKLEDQSKFLTDNADRLGAAGDPSKLYLNKNIDATTIPEYERTGRASVLQQRPQFKPEAKPVGEPYEDEKFGLLQKYDDGSVKKISQERGAGVTVTNQDKSFITKQLELSAKPLEQYNAQREKTASTLSLVSKMREVQKDPRYFGPQADIQAKAMGLLQGVFGIDLGDNKAAYTDYVNRLGKEGLANLIAGASGKSTTDQDVKTMATQFFDSASTPQTMELALQDMKRSAKNTQASLDRTLEHYRREAPNSEYAARMYELMSVPGINALPMSVDDKPLDKSAIAKPPIPSAGDVKRGPDGLIVRPPLPPGVELVP